MNIDAGVQAFAKQLGCEDEYKAALEIARALNRKTKGRMDWKEAAKEVLDGKRVRRATWPEGRSLYIDGDTCMDTAGNAAFLPFQGNDWELYEDPLPSARERCVALNGGQALSVVRSEGGKQWVVGTLWVSVKGSSELVALRRLATCLEALKGMPE